jgi:hypothetical protein
LRVLGISHVKSMCSMHLFVKKSFTGLKRYVFCCVSLDIYPAKWAIADSAVNEGTFKLAA